MALDGLMLAAIVRQLKKLEGSKIGKIQNISDEEILFNTHGVSGGQKLLINVHSNTNRLYLSSAPADFLPAPSNFVMVLRKYLIQGLITSIEQAGFDRIVKISILGHNEFQDLISYDLYAELMGKYANLILVDSKSQTIIDCLKRIPVYENSKRLLHPGAKYEVPAQKEKQSPLNPLSLDLNSSLVSQVEGFSPLLSREFLHRLKNGENFADITDKLLHSDSLYVYGKEFHVLPLTHMGQKETRYELMDGLNRLFTEDENKIRLSQQCGDLFKTVDRELKRLEKKLPRLEASLTASKDYDIYRTYGDLLFAYMYQIKKEPTITVENFETGEPIQIPIDMRFDLKDNANLYYKKYHKLKRSQAILEEQIQQCLDEIEYFKQMKEQLEFCGADDAIEIRQELISEKYLLPKNQKNIRRKKAKAPHVLHLKVDEADIYVGKNNLQNNFITWKVGRKNDLWFHVQGYHGSHVLLQTENATEDLIRLCAMLASYFSKGKDSSSVPVDYTKISQLKKVPGSKIGFVTMKSYKTIYIDPDVSLVEKHIKNYTKK